MTSRLTGKTAIITGAASGIGSAIVRAFCQEGASVYITDVNADKGRALAAKTGGIFKHLDVTNEEQWLTLSQEIQGLDIMVNNAGITGLEGGDTAHDPEHTSLEDWRQVHAINLDGTFLGCKYAIKMMRSNKGGSIINLSSRSGIVGIPGAAAYASSKAAIRNHTKSVALYCAEQDLNIRCNSIHPAAIRTPMWEAMLGEDGPGKEARIRQMMATTPMHRFGKVEEVAALAVFLASEEAPFMTGSELTIDGGILAGTANSPGRTEE